MDILKVGEHQLNQIGIQRKEGFFLYMCRCFPVDNTNTGWGWVGIHQSSKSHECDPSAERVIILCVVYLIQISTERYDNECKETQCIL